MTQCSVDSCERPTVGQGLCDPHYRRKRRTGTAEGAPIRQPQSTLDRFWAKVDKTDACWLWTARIHPTGGYGVFYLDGKLDYAHRASYLLNIGPIPDGMHIDHVKARGCTNRHCVRPEHLEAVPPRENNARSESITAQRARQTHCSHGHEFTEANTYRHRGHRHCKTCRAQTQERRAHAAARQQHEVASPGTV